MKRKNMLLLLLVAILGACTQDEIRDWGNLEDTEILPGNGSASEQEWDQWVDMGLSVQWASYNVGAYEPYQIGDYYAWGEIQTKDRYESFNCSTEGVRIGSLAGDPDYDVATLLWGEEAQIPSKEQFEELISQCDVKDTLCHGVKCLLFRSQVNGNKILLNANLSYWTSSPSNTGLTEAYCYEHNLQTEEVKVDFRFRGKTVRPVKSENGSVAKIHVVTGAAKEVSSISADVICDFEHIPSYAECGVEFMTEGGYAVRKELVEVVADGTYIVSLTGLLKNTKYQYRGFVRYNNKTVYGEYKEFTTASTAFPGVELWVDLGLSVKWASHNIGAEIPEDYGSYFAWGEIEPKNFYDEENSLTYKKTWSSIAGEPKYDAATAQWGAPARMPTLEEIEELKSKCTAKWIADRGMEGLLLTSQVNGNSIFLPAAGDYFGGSSGLVDEREQGHYWTATPDEMPENQGYSSYQFGFGKDGTNTFGWSRYRGLSIRPVMGDSKPMEQTKVTTGSVTTVTGTTAEVSCAYTNFPKGAICGIEYKDNAGHVKEQVVSVASAGIQTIILQDLTPGTAYSFRGFVRWNGLIVYGEYNEFTTQKDFDSNLWVDLGLSVLWATHNVGANFSEEYGDYFAWGEIEPKTTFTEENCLTYNKQWGDFSGDSRYDAATAKWGNGARMPTRAEVQELLDNCKFQYESRNGVEGCLFISKNNGRSIFFPRPGYHTESGHYNVGGSGYCWSSTPGEKLQEAYGFDIAGPSDYMLSTVMISRYNGISIRPVRSK